MRHRGSFPHLLPRLQPGAAGPPCPAAAGGDSRFEAARVSLVEQPSISRSAAGSAGHPSYLCLARLTARKGASSRSLLAVPPWSQQPLPAGRSPTDCDPLSPR